MAEVKVCGLPLLPEAADYRGGWDSQGRLGFVADELR